MDEITVIRVVDRDAAVDARRPHRLVGCMRPTAVDHIESIDCARAGARRDGTHHCGRENKLQNSPHRSLLVVLDKCVWSVVRSRMTVELGLTAAIDRRTILLRGTDALAEVL